jgi:hypothetical protein
MYYSIFRNPVNLKLADETHIKHIFARHSVGVAHGD